MARRRKTTARRSSSQESHLRKELAAEYGEGVVDWRIQFAEAFANKRGGFDIVLANPPYVRQELITHLKPALRKVFPNVYAGGADLFIYFYARAVQLLRAAASFRSSRPTSSSAPRTARSSASIWPTTPVRASSSTLVTTRFSKPSRTRRLSLPEKCRSRDTGRARPCLRTTGRNPTTSRKLGRRLLHKARAYRKVH